MEHSPPPIPPRQGGGTEIPLHLRIKPEAVASLAEQGNNSGSGFPTLSSRSLHIILSLNSNAPISTLNTNKSNITPDEVMLAAVDLIDPPHGTPSWAFLHPFFSHYSNHHHQRSHDPQWVTHLHRGISNHWFTTETTTGPNFKIQTVLTDTNRKKLLNWLVQIQQDFGLRDETFHLAIYLLDRCLSIVVIPSDRFQLLGVGCLLLASKYEEIHAPGLLNLVHVTNDSFTVQDLAVMERTIFHIVGYRINTPFSIDFANYFLNGLFLDTGTILIVYYILDRLLLEVEVLNAFTPSQQSIAAITYALFVTNQTSLLESFILHAGIAHPHHISSYCQLIEFIWQLFTHPLSSHNQLARKYQTRNYAHVSLIPHAVPHPANYPIALPIAARQHEIQKQNIEVQQQNEIAKQDNDKQLRLRIAQIATQLPSNKRTQFTIDAYINAKLEELADLRQSFFEFQHNCIRSMYPLSNSSALPEPFCLTTIPEGGLPGILAEIETVHRQRKQFEALFNQIITLQAHVDQFTRAESLKLMINTEINGPETVLSDETLDAIGLQVTLNSTPLTQPAVTTAPNANDNNISGIGQAPQNNPNQLIAPTNTHQFVNFPLHQLYPPLPKFTLLPHDVWLRRIADIRRIEKFIEKQYPELFESMHTTTHEFFQLTTQFTIPPRSGTVYETGIYSLSHYLSQMIPMEGTSDDGQTTILTPALTLDSAMPRYAFPRNIPIPNGPRRFFIPQYISKKLETICSHIEIQRHFSTVVMEARIFDHPNLLLNGQITEQQNNIIKKNHQRFMTAYEAYLQHNPDSSGHYDQLISQGIMEHFLIQPPTTYNKDNDISINKVQSVIQYDIENNNILQHQDFDTFLLNNHAKKHFISALHTNSPLESLYKYYINSKTPSNQLTYSSMIDSNGNFIPVMYHGAKNGPNVLKHLQRFYHYFISSRNFHKQANFTSLCQQFIKDYCTGDFGTTVSLCTKDEFQHNDINVVINNFIPRRINHVKSNSQQKSTKLGNDDELYKDYDDNFNDDDQMDQLNMLKQGQRQAQLLHQQPPQRKELITNRLRQFKSLVNSQVNIDAKIQHCNKNNNNNNKNNNKKLQQVQNKFVQKFVQNGDNDDDDDQSQTHISDFATMPGFTALQGTITSTCVDAIKKDSCHHLTLFNASSEQFKAKYNTDPSLVGQIYRDMMNVDLSKDTINKIESTSNHAEIGLYMINDTNRIQHNTINPTSKQGDTNSIDHNLYNSLVTLLQLDTNCAQDDENTINQHVIQRCITELQLCNKAKIVNLFNHLEQQYFAPIVQNNNNNISSSLSKHDRIVSSRIVLLKNRLLPTDEIISSDKIITKTDDDEHADVNNNNNNNNDLFHKNSVLNNQKIASFNFHTNPTPSTGASTIASTTTTPFESSTTDSMSSSSSILMTDEDDDLHHKNSSFDILDNNNSNNYSVSNNSMNRTITQNLRSNIPKSAEDCNHQNIDNDNDTLSHMQQQQQPHLQYVSSCDKTDTMVSQHPTQIRYAQPSQPSQSTQQQQQSQQYIENEFVQSTLCQLNSNDNVINNTNNNNYYRTSFAPQHDQNVSLGRNNSTTSVDSTSKTLQRLVVTDLNDDRHPSGDGAALYKTPSQDLLCQIDHAHSNNNNNKNNNTCALLQNGQSTHQQQVNSDFNIINTRSAIAGEESYDNVNTNHTVSFTLNRPDGAQFLSRLSQDTFMDAKSVSINNNNNNVIEDTFRNNKMHLQQKSTRNRNLRDLESNDRELPRRPVRR